MGNDIQHPKNLDRRSDTARAWPRVLFGICAPLASAALIWCGPSPELCSPFQLGSEYRLLATVIEIDGERIAASATGCGGTKEMFACSRSDGRYISISIRNRMDVPLVIEWAEAELHDEKGRVHMLVEFPDPIPDGELVPPGSDSFWQKLVPAEKRSLRRAPDGLLYQHIEHFIPWQADSCLERGPVDEFYEARRRVLVVLPITIDGGEDRTITFQMNLDAVSERDFYKRLAASGGY